MLIWIGGAASLIVLFVITVTAGLLLRRRKRRRAIDRQVSNKLLRCTHHVENGRVYNLGDAPPRRVLRGRFHNRNFELIVDVDTAKQRAAMRVEIDVPQTFELTIERRRAGQRMNVRNLKIGDARLDERLNIRSPQHYDALYFLKQDKIPHVVEQLLGEGLLRLTMGRGKLHARFAATAPAEVVDPESVIFRLTLLSWFTDSLIQLQITQSGGELGLLLPDVKCPYCQSPIGDDPDGVGRLSLVACLKCCSPHHEECWRDNGKCAIYGCDAQPHERKPISLD